VCRTAAHREIGNVVLHEWSANGHDRPLGTTWAQRIWSPATSTIEIRNAKKGAAFGG